MEGGGDKPRTSRQQGRSSSRSTYLPTLGSHCQRRHYLRLTQPVLVTRKCKAFVYNLLAHKMSAMSLLNTFHQKEYVNNNKFVLFCNIFRLFYVHLAVILRRSLHVDREHGGFVIYTGPRLIILALLNQMMLVVWKCGKWTFISLSCCGKGGRARLHGQDRARVAGQSWANIHKGVTHVWLTIMSQMVAALNTNLAAWRHKNIYDHIIYIIYNIYIYI